MNDDRRSERRILLAVLSINFFFFLLEALTGIIAHSMGLVADSMDMFADSVVYGLALFAVGGTAVRKSSVAKVAGYLQLLIALIGFAEVLHRSIGGGPLPNFKVMIAVSLLALVGNVVSLHLLNRNKSQEAHMTASRIFTSNDVVINIGVILSGALVYLMDSKYPDLVIGGIIFAIVTRGALRILKLSN